MFHLLLRWHKKEFTVQWATTACAEGCVRCLLRFVPVKKVFTVQWATTACAVGCVCCFLRFERAGWPILTTSVIIIIFPLETKHSLRELNSFNKLGDVCAKKCFGNL